MSLEVTRDQVDKRQFDGLALKNKKPGFIYRWSRRDDFQVALNRFNGYEIVDRSEDKVESVLNSGTRMKKGEDVDTTVVLGDLVLMSMPTEKYESRRRDEVQLALRRQAAVTKGYHAEIARVAGQTGVSYEAGHFMGSGQAGMEEERRADAADRAGKRDKMSGGMSEADWDKELNRVDNLNRGSN